MIRNSFILFILMSFVAKSEELKINFNHIKFIHLTFDDIPKTSYEIKDGVITAKVNQSSSILFYPLQQMINVARISFEYKLTGNLKIKSAAAEKTKKGDDAPIRVGLIIKGEGSMVPFFAPAWIKKTKSALKYPTDRMIYIAGGSKSTPGSQWENPYSDSITVKVAHCKQQTDGWQVCQSDLKKVMPVIGIWILADGDNSESQFTSNLRNLQLEVIQPPPTTSPPPG